jgi:hypothetical protein
MRCTGCFSYAVPPGHGGLVRVRTTSDARGFDGPRLEPRPRAEGGAPKTDLQAGQAGGCASANMVFMPAKSLFSTV